MTLQRTFFLDPVYGRRAGAIRRRAVCLSALALGAALIWGAPRVAQAQTGDATIVDARDALRAKDGARLAEDRDAALKAAHPLAMWVDYWELTNRLDEAQQSELDAFAARWPGSYVEDRLRNDWLLELGKRHDWVNFAAEYPRFRMNDDRDVSCYALLVEHLGGKDVRAAALEAWLAQRDADDGCALLATTLFDAKQIGTADVWRKVRAAIDAHRPGAARQAVALIGPDAARSMRALLDKPARYLARDASAKSRDGAELAAMAIARMADHDPDAAATQLKGRWERALPVDLSAWAWAMVAKQTAIELKPEAADRYLRAAQRAAKSERELALSESTLEWKVRAALRADGGHPRWQQVMQAINAMDEGDQREPAWVYWKARALLAMASDSQEAPAMRALGRELMGSIAGPLDFYGALAAESLGRAVTIPARPAPLTVKEKSAAASTPGLVRGLQLIDLGLRSEGVREWNFTLRGMTDRELLAAAQLACDHKVWDRCINTSDRTRTEIDVAQRYPMPFREELVAQAHATGVDPAYVYGLIRQESRFIMDARSGAGASGLMQLMPATARWTAKKIGLPYTHDLIADRETNLKLGTAYLKLVLDDFDGSSPLAAAAYNAGPSRSRRWREGPKLEPAVWAENIPFSETRNYVKKVLSNGAIYAALISGQPPSLRERLGGPITPAAANSLDKELP